MFRGLLLLSLTLLPFGSVTYAQEKTVQDAFPNAHGTSIDLDVNGYPRTIDNPLQLARILTSPNPVFKDPLCIITALNHDPMHAALLKVGLTAKSLSVRHDDGTRDDRGTPLPPGAVPPFLRMFVSYRVPEDVDTATLRDSQGYMVVWTGFKDQHNEEQQTIELASGKAIDCTLNPTPK